MVTGGRLTGGELWFYTETAWKSMINGGSGPFHVFFANNWNNECYSKKAAPIPFLSTHHHMHHLHTICALFAHTMHTPCTHQVHTSQTPLTCQKFEKTYFLDKVKNKFNASMIIQNTCFLEWLLKSKGNLKFIEVTLNWSLPGFDQSPKSMIHEKDIKNPNVNFH